MHQNIASLRNDSAEHIPFITDHRGAELERVALPVGGIGTGTISVGGRGDLRDWEIVNHSSKGFSPARRFFAVSIRKEGKPLDARLLEGALPLSAYEGDSGSPYSLAGMPRFADTRCQTVYPFIQIALSDPASPIEASLLAYNPFVPGDVDGSGWPAAVFEISLKNKTGNELDASVLFGCDNFLGTDGIDRVECRLKNREIESKSLKAVLLRATGWPRDCELRGDFCLAVEKTGCRTSSAAGTPVLNWNNDFRTMWERFSAQGRVFSPAKEKSRPIALVCAEQSLRPHRRIRFRFYLTWRFPNRLSWSTDRAKGRAGRVVVGNYYAKLGSTSWEITRRFAARLPALRTKTLAFTQAFAGNDLPPVLREAALANLPALRSQTLFRTRDGRFFGYEGGHRDKYVGGTLGSCTHVWGYDLATFQLFPEISRSFRHLQFGEQQHLDGAIAFRAGLPVKAALRYQEGKVAADGHLASIIAYYRDWLIQGDEPWVRRLWLRVKKALRFCWQKGSWDADGDGVMEGCQHNTMDVDYYGPNPQIQGLYVTALRCGARLAEAFGDPVLARRCAALAKQGSCFLDQKLFNNEYFIQKVPRRIRRSDIDPRLTIADPKRPLQLDYQVGPGLLIDHLLGGLHAQVCGIEECAGTARTRSALRAVVRHNFRVDLGEVANHMRSFGLRGEAGVLMATWPRGGKPVIPFPYYPEVMTGFEHILAAHLLYQGEERLALRIVAAVRARHTGRQRNPFNEAEWGNHYARALASWGSLWAFTGQHYDVQSATLKFRNPGKDATWFWVVGGSWGTISFRFSPKSIAVQLLQVHGNLTVDRLEIGKCLAILQKEKTNNPGWIKKQASVILHQS